MKVFLKWFNLAICIILAPSALRLHAQEVPIPEYYGVYVVDGTHLVKVDSRQVQASSQTTVRFGVRNGVGNILQNQPTTLAPTSVSVPVFPANFKIIVYLQSGSSELASSINLIPLVFIDRFSVDTGFPSNVRRTDREGGWDDGDPAEILVANVGSQPQNLELLLKPVPGHPDMVIAGLAEPLKPGVYRISQGHRDQLDLMMGQSKGLLFAIQPVAEGQAQSCVNATTTYVMMTLSKNSYQPCDHKPSQTGQSDAASATACQDYASCFQGGVDAWKSHDWEGAAQNFKAATSKDSTKGEAWLWLGRAYLASGKTEDIPAAWDKAIELGSILIIGACHERSFGGCEGGDLSLSSRVVSFGRGTKPPLFSDSPSNVLPQKVLSDPNIQYSSFTLRVDNKNYVFDFFPFGVECSAPGDAEIKCPSDGVAQQLAVGLYISQAIPKIASGALGKKIDH